MSKVGMMREAESWRQPEQQLREREEEQLVHVQTQVPSGWEKSGKASLGGAHPTGGQAGRGLETRTQEQRNGGGAVPAQLM